jgi:hypothetical protein
MSLSGKLLQLGIRMGKEGTTSRGSQAHVLVVNSRCWGKGNRVLHEDMITPVFRIQQDDTSITLLITAPYARLADAEILINGNEFKFFASPYFLRYVINGMGNDIVAQMFTIVTDLCYPVNYQIPKKRSPMTVRLEFSRSKS